MKSCYRNIYGVWVHRGGETPITAILPMAGAPRPGCSLRRERQAALDRGVLPVARAAHLDQVPLGPPPATQRFVQALGKRPKRHLDSKPEVSPLLSSRSCRAFSSSVRRDRSSISVLASASHPAARPPARPLPGLFWTGSHEFERSAPSVPCLQTSVLLGTPQVPLRGEGRTLTTNTSTPSGSCTRPSSAF